MDKIFEEAMEELKQELEKQYLGQSIIFMNPTDWDDILKYSKSWQETIESIIKDEKYY